MHGDKKEEIVPADNLKCPKCEQDFDVYRWAAGITYIECRKCRKRGMFQIDEDGKLHELKRDKMGRRYKNAL